MYLHHHKQFIQFQFLPVGRITARKAITKARTITLKHRNYFKIFYANFAEIKFKGTSSQGTQAIISGHLTAIPIFQAAKHNL